MQYLINVFMSLTSYLAVAGVLLMIGHLLVPFAYSTFTNKSAKGNVTLATVKRYTNRLSVIVIVVGLLLAIFSSANTYKHETFDRHADAARIESMRHTETTAEVKDVLRKPKHTEGEREDRFNDLIDYAEKSDESN